MSRAKYRLPRYSPDIPSLLLIVAVLVTTFATSAQANNYMVPNSNYSPLCTEGSAGSGVVCQTDNAQVSYYMDSNGEFELEAPDRADVNTAIDNEYDAPVTDLNFTYDSTPDFEGGSETDIVYQEGFIDGFVGYAWCNDDLPGFKCDQTYVRIRGDGNYTTGLVCHETGHAVGLVHGQNTASRFDNQDAARMGCMVKANIPALSTLRIAQQNEIDDVYPN